MRDNAPIAKMHEQRLTSRAVAREASGGWWSQGESNPRPRECHSRALPTELWPQISQIYLPLLGTQRTRSALFFFLDRLANDVGHVGVAFFLLLDEGGIVEALVAYLDFFFFTSLCLGVGRRWLLALLFGLGVLERNEFRVGGLGHNALGGRYRRGPRGYWLRPRACRR